MIALSKSKNRRRIQCGYLDGGKSRCPTACRAFIFGLCDADSQSMEDREIQDVVATLQEWLTVGANYGFEAECACVGLFFEQYPDLLQDANWHWSNEAILRYYGHDSIANATGDESKPNSQDGEDWDFYLLTLGLVGFANARRLPSGSLWELFWETSTDEGPPCLDFERAPKRDRTAKLNRELYLRALLELDQIVGLH